MGLNWLQECESYLLKLLLEMMFKHGRERIKEKEQLESSHQNPSRICQKVLICFKDAKD